MQEFAADGRFLRSWVDNENNPGNLGGHWSETTGLQGPVGICFDKQGLLWISAVSGGIQQFPPEGNDVQCLGSGRGGDPGQFEPPDSLAADDTGLVYVVDSLNHRVQKFAIEK